ncbi:DUF1707 domain-containing protein [Streptomyces sp. NPDC058486]|uniref:DUF1707 SHOCT-like domain-containing protein n=1 Tax=unclassified Streptomyces TaxID=2593676 RepID=UPI0036611989
MEDQPERPADPMRKPDRPKPKKDAAPAVRVSDQERDAVVGRLAVALTEGRLDPYEHAERVEAALRARTAGELAVLTADLPAPRPSAEERKRKELAEWYAEWRHWLGGLVIMTAIWGVNGLGDGDVGFYWPVTPLAIWAAVLVAAALRPRGKKDDDPA